MGPLDRNWLRRFRGNLKRWYARHARDLPWRRSRDPYRIWISEIMLQQTTVAAVTPYFERFLERFPTLKALARASEEDVLRLWEGLGYYSRARNIHKAARRLVADFDCQFPADPAQLQELPGIGRYTAGAIASFAFNRPAPIVEANTQRLYCRLLGEDRAPRSSAAQRRLWDFAAAVLPRREPGTFNQALMELGAQVCVPSEPDCPACPVRSCCAAFARGAQSEIPAATPRPEITPLTEAYLAIRRRRKYFLVRRGENERWAGLWDFPRVPLDDFSAVDSPPEQLHRLLAQWAADEIGLRIGSPTMLREVRHSVTRYRIRLLCFEARLLQCLPSNGNGETRWCHPDDLQELPLSVTGRKLARTLEAKSRT